MFAVVLLVACGDDAAAGPAGAGGTGASPVREACAQPGGTETGCRCEGVTTGHRTCSAGGVWSACSCPPREAACTEGEVIECTCPRDLGTRMTTCLVGGTFDCPCPATGGSGADFDGG